MNLKEQATQPSVQYCIIPLTQGKFTVVDSEDYEQLNSYKWNALKRKDRWYAGRKEGKRAILMHRYLLGVSDYRIRVDHHDGDGLNNRRYNLRRATNAQNLWNRQAQRNNTSGFKGVWYHKRANKWTSGIWVNGKQIYLGLHSTAEQAHVAYIEAAKKHHGDFARW